LKKFFLIFLCLISCLFSFGLSGCSNGNHSKDDIDTLFKAMQTNELTSQFFDGDYFSVSFDNSKVGSNQSSNKSYIFPYVYSHYLKCSSGLLSSVIQRVEKISYAVKSFPQNELNIVYNKLNDVYISLVNLANDKAIFELTNGNLHYKNVINSYNSLIKQLYSLNESFAEFYFNGVGNVDFSKVELSDGNIRDMMWYQLLLTSKVSFNYDFLNFVSSNPRGEILTWYNSTTLLKDYISDTSSIINKIRNTENLASHLGIDKVYVKPIFVNMQNQEIEFLNEYSKFIDNISVFNLKSYFASTNKDAFILSCSRQEQSCFTVSQTFINGRYAAFMDGLIYVSNYL